MKLNFGVMFVVRWQDKFINYEIAEDYEYFYNLKKNESNFH